jgi:hypothetical protein
MAVFHRITIVFIFCLYGCSATPKYLDTRTVEEKKSIESKDVLSSEVVVLKASRKSINEQKFEYDISSLPTGVTINKAILRVGVKEKIILARSLGGASAAELSVILIPTPFYGSRMKVADLDYFYATNSNIKYDTSALSPFERTGGTGGKASYYSQGAGFDEWDVTDALKYSIKNKKPFTFRLGVVPLSFLDLTIFSSSYKFRKFEFGHLKEAPEYSLLTVYFE